MGEVKDNNVASIKVVRVEPISSESQWLLFANTADSFLKTITYKINTRVYSYSTLDKITLLSPKC